MKCSVLWLHLTSVVWSGLGLADTTIDEAESFAFASNLGWLDFRTDRGGIAEGVVVQEYVLSGYVYAANVGWINFGNGSPVDGIRYRNDNAKDFGVNHDGQGNLWGLAYGVNIGWISFGESVSITSTSRPRVRLSDGVFAGFAHSANCGWINLGAGGLRTRTIQKNDMDGDGISDAWERENFSSSLSVATALSDADKDGSTDKEEYLANTDPNDPASRFRVISTELGADLSTVTLAFTTSPGRFYYFESSPDLKQWTRQDTFAPLLIPAWLSTFPLQGGDSEFFRLGVVRPLQPNP